MSDDNFAPDHLEGVEYIMRKQNNDLLGGIIAQQQTRIEELEAKLAQQDDLVQAAVVAALREAAERMRHAAATEDEFGRIINAAIFDTAVKLILDLITPDAQAALDRALAARFGMVRAEVVRLSVEGKIDREAAERLLAAIRKGGE